MTRSYTPRRAWVLEFLQSNPGSDIVTIAQAVYTHPRNALHLLRALQANRQVYISGWRKQNGEGLKGRPMISLWSTGDKPDAEKPPRDSKSVIQARRKQRLKAEFGDDYRAILRPRSKGGASLLVRDGEIVYRRSAVRGLDGGRRPICGTDQNN